MAERREFVGGVLSRTTNYTYGLDGTLAAATFTGGINDGSRIDYTYDHTGELVGRKLTDSFGAVASDDRYLVDRENLTGYSQRLAVIDGLTGAVKSFNTFTDQLAAQASVTGSAVTTSHLQTDGLGSIRNLTSTDAGGQSTSEAYDYTAFGSLTAGDRSLTDYAFTGQVADSATSLQYHRARWLDTENGSWTTNDPISDFPRNFALPLAYAGLNPINQTDPNGLFSLGELNITGAIQSLLTTYVLPSVAESLARAVFSAIGLDPIVLLAPIIEWISEAFNLSERAAAIAELMRAGLDALNMDALLEVMLKLVSFLTILDLILQAIDTVMVLVKLFLRKTLKNAVEAGIAIFTLASSFYSFSQEVEIQINPRKVRTIWAGPINKRTNFHHLATNKGKKSKWMPMFKKIFKSANLSMNNKHNLIPITDHFGPHPTEYHAWVHSRLNKTVKKKSFRNAPLKQRKRMLKKSLENIGNALLNNEQGMLDLITRR